MRESPFDEFFTVQEHFSGKLRIGGNIIGYANADFTLNEFDTNRMALRIVDTHWRRSDSKAIRAQQTPANLEFVTEDKWTRRVFKFRETGLFRFDRATLDVIEYQVYEKQLSAKRRPARKIIGIKASYLFPLVTLLKERGQSASLRLSGFMWDPNYNASDSQPSGGFLTVEDLKPEIEDDPRYHAKLSAQRSNLTFEIHERRLSLEQFEKVARERARIILFAVSLLEGDSIYWKIENLSLRGKDGGRIATRLTYRWAMPHSDQFFAVNRGQPIELRKLLPQIVNSYFELTSDKRNTFSQAMHVYQLACIASVIEVQFVYWFACLDFLKKQTRVDHRVHPKGKHFSEKLKIACEQQGIEIEDLGLRRSSKMPEMYRFVEIRNDYMHDGLMVEDYSEMITERTKLKALAERLILKLLGIDYRETPLGIPYIW